MLKNPDNALAIYESVVTKRADIDLAVNTCFLYCLTNILGKKAQNGQ
ncbi:MAG: hypothetical protein GQ529_01145 [Methyloprofundus sp.]|nr:hypothetical protein [Methyloprofundus sp.]